MGSKFDLVAGLCVPHTHGEGSQTPKQLLPFWPSEHCHTLTAHTQHTTFRKQPNQTNPLVDQVSLSPVGTNLREQCVRERISPAEPQSETQKQALRNWKLQRIPFMRQQQTSIACHEQERTRTKNTTSTGRNRAVVS